MEQFLQCMDTMSLYRLALKVALSSLSKDRERHIMREVRVYFPLIELYGVGNV